MKNIKKFGFVLISVFMLLLVVSCGETNEYTVNLKYEDGTSYKTVTVEEGKEITLDVLTKEGHTFLGWFLDDVLQENEFIPKGNVELIAKFEINKYTYKFIVNGTVVKEEILNYGSTIVYPENPKNTDTLEFIGWDNDATILKENEVFTAKFREVNVGTTNTYTYKFVDFDGTVLKEETSNEGSTIIYPSNPTKAATVEYTYTFTGWDKNDTILTKDIVFTAVYASVKNQYTYKFVDFDGTVLKEEKVDYGTKIVAPSNPTREDSSVFTYEFIGWDKEFDVVTGDIEINAKYKETEKESSNPSHTHTEVVLPEVEATCTKTGLTEGKKCSSCGKVLVAQKEVAKKDHNYENGKCTVCDADDPNYTAPITSLEGLKVSILGDSISTFYSSTSTINSYYGQEGRYYYPIYSSTVKTVEKTWWYQLINNNKMAWGINNSWSGSAAYGSGESAGQSDARINTIDDNGMPDIVIIFLGTNDCASGFSVSNYSNAIKTMITKIRKLGNPQIFLTTLGYSDYDSNNYKVNRILYNEALRKIAGEYNCGIVPLDEYIVETSYMFYLGDRLHHNAKGAELLSKIYEKTIKEYNGIPYTGKIEVEHEEPLPEGVIGKITATANSGFWTGYETNVYFTTSSSAANAIYSTTYEITKNTADGKYYVTKINSSGNSANFGGDYVLMISDAHKDNTQLVQSLKNVKVGSVVEFDVNGAFPKEIVFKEGDGTLPSNPSTPSTPTEKVEGELNIGAYNEGVWTKYENTVMAYSYSSLGQGSKYINFYIIGLTKTSGNDYQITCLKGLNDNSFSFPQCDYYILIYMDLEEKSYYENAKVGDMVTVNGSITSGTCSIAFK